MKNNFEPLKKIIIDTEYLFINEIIEKIWNDEPENYNIEISDINFVDFDNYTIIFSDFESIEIHNISKTIAFEYWDDLSMNYESDRVKKCKIYCNSTNTNYNITSFNYFCSMK